MELRLTGQSVGVTGRDVLVRSAFLAEGTFDLSNVPLGSYTGVVVVGTEERRLTNAVEVIDPNTTTLRGQIIAPAGMRAGRTSDIQIVVERDFLISGVVDKPSPFLLLESNQPDAFFRTSPGKPWSRSVFLIGGRPGKAGQLNGGDRAQFNLQMKAPNRDVRVRMSLKAVPSFKAELFANGWAMIKEPSRPRWIEPDVWDQSWDNWVGEFGVDADEFMENVREGAEWLEERGAPSRDLTDVLALGLRRAQSRVVPMPVLSASTDLYVYAPEIPLTLNRYMPSSIDGRGRRSALGRGWTHGYDWRIEDAPNDGLVLLLPSGQLRSFASTRPDTYSEIGGGSATLERIAGGLVLREVDGFVHRFADGRHLTSIQGALGTTVTIDRNLQNPRRVESVTHSSGATIQFGYDLLGRLVSAQDSTGRTVAYGYGAGDQAEYLSQVEEVGGRVLRMQYIPPGNGANSHALSRIDYPEGKIRLFEYEDGRIRRLSLGGGQQPITFSYAGGKGQVDVTDETGRGVRMKVGSGSLPVMMQALHSGDDGPVVSFSYSPVGDLKEIQSQAGTWRGTHDSKRNLVESQDRLGILRGAAFSTGANSLQWERDGRGNIYQLELDHRDLPIQAIYPDGSREVFVRDGFGRVIEERNRRGQIIRYNYNEAGQLVQTVLPDRIITNVYDGAQRLTLTECSRTGWIRYSYDARDYVTRVDYENGRWVRYEHDDAGKRLRMESSDGQLLRYSYDPNGTLREVRIGPDPSDLLIGFTHDSSGRVLSERRGNDTRTEYQYNPAGHVSRIQHFRGQVLQAEFAYSYDEDGLPLTAQTPEGAWAYTYDAEGQLIRYTMPDGTLVVIEYDAEGNRLRRFVNGVPTHYTTNSLNQYTAIGPNPYGYDADGNLTLAYDENNQPVSMQYDALGRLVRQEGAGGVTAFEYDSAGNLTSMTSNGITRSFLFDGKRVIAEFDPTNELSRRFWHANGLVGQQTAKRSEFFGYDITGHTRLVTGSDGSVRARAAFDPFGGVILTQGALDSEFLFCGRLGQRALPGGGVLMGQRVYNTSLGRFQQVDGLRLASDSLNMYRYGANSPIAFSDPTGTIPIWLGPLARAAWTAYEAYSAYDSAREVHDAAMREYVKDESVLDALDAAAKQTLWELGPEHFAKIPIKRWGRDAISRHDREYMDYIERLKEHGRVDGLREALIHDKLGRDRLKRYQQNAERATDVYGDLVKESIDEEGGDPENGGHLDDHETEVSTSYDPNEKAGAKGTGPEGWVTPNEEFVYTVYFENLPSARAHAQEVFVTDVLDASLDLSTLELREVNISGENYSNVSGFQQGLFRVPFKDTGLVAEVGVSFDIAARTLRWTMRSLDPLTNDVPDEIDRGLLPPNDASGRGEGYVRFVIKPRSAVVDGTKIRNQARIVFDTNPPIDTNVWMNRIDTKPPVSRVRPHTGVRISPTRAVIEWSGSDGSGSGIDRYDIYYRELNGTWAPWLIGTQGTRGIFTGTRGRTYEFMSVSTDLVGRREAMKQEAEAIVKF